MGTPAYMAPEQARGELDRVDERADVFALGSILCEVLTRQPAFAGGHSTEIVREAVPRATWPTRPNGWPHARAAPSSWRWRWITWRLNATTARATPPASSSG